MARLQETLNLVLAGLLAPLHGLRMLLARRSLWPYAAVPFFCGLAWSALSFADWSLPAGEVWWSRALLAVTHYLLEAGVLFLQVLIALASPLFDLLSEQTEEELGVRPRGQSFWREIFSFRFARNAVRAGIEAGKLLSFKLAVYLVAFLLGLVPVVGPWLAYPLSGMVTGLDFLDYSLARRQWSLRDKLDLMRRQAGALVGYGIVFFALLEIPGIGGLALVPAAVGGTWLLARVEAIRGTPTSVDPGRSL